MPDGLRAGLERSWLGGGTFAQACNAASPRPSAGADSLVTALIAEHTGDLIVEIDLTRIGPVSRALPFGSDPPRSAPLRAAALRTAQTMAAEKIDRSRTELPLCIGLSACVAELGPSTSRVTIQNSAYAFWLFRTWTPPNSKKQASEITQVTRRGRRSFRRTSPTLSMPSSNQADLPAAMPSSTHVTIRPILNLGPPTAREAEPGRLVLGQFD